MGKQSGYRIKRKRWGTWAERSWAEGTQRDGEGKEGFLSHLLLGGSGRQGSRGGCGGRKQPLSGVLIPTPQNPSPPATPATCAVPVSTARPQGYCPATEPLCGLWTHQPPAAGPTAAAALWRWVPGAAWRESGPGTSPLSGQPVPEPYNPGAVAPAGGGNDITPSPA